MNKFNSYKKNFYFTLAILFVLFIGIGYAVLSERLLVDTSISYNSMKWDVGFDRVVELNSVDFEGNLIADTTIADDKKSLSISCDLGTATSKIGCITRVTIKNNGTFDVVLKRFEEIGIDHYSDYIEESYFTWNATSRKVIVSDKLRAGESLILDIKYTFKELDASMLPSKGLNMTFGFEMEWVEDDGTILPPYSIGQEIDLGGEKFNIIDYDDDTITMLAKYSLGRSYVQSSTPDHAFLYSVGGWEYAPGPKEIDLKQYSDFISPVLDLYQEYLQHSIWDESLTVDLITLKQLGDLGCSISADYSYNTLLSCNSSPYKEWLIINSTWWTKSAVSNSQYDVWYVGLYGNLGVIDCSTTNELRPVVTISREVYENNVLAFTIEDETYYALEGMTWAEWVNSEFNLGSFIISDDRIYRSSGGTWLLNVAINSVIIEGDEYSLTFLGHNGGSND